LLGHFVFFSGPTRDIQVMGFNLPAKSFMTGFYIFTGVLILSTGYLINRLVNHFVTRKTRRQDA
jgi:nitrate reductase gamma subunit